MWTGNESNALSSTGANGIRGGDHQHTSLKLEFSWFGICPIFWYDLDIQGDMLSKKYLCGPIKELTEAGYLTI